MQWQPLKVVTLKSQTMATWQGLNHDQSMNPVMTGYSTLEQLHLNQWNYLSEPDGLAEMRDYTDAAFL